VVTVGIISPGAMGSAVGRALAAGGARVVATLEGRSARTERLAEGIELLPSLDAVVIASEIVLSIVPPGAAVQVVQDIGDAARRAGGGPLVADLNAVAPTTMATVAATLAGAGLAAVDGSISGGPPRAGGTTFVYLAGVRAGEVAALKGTGLEFVVVGEAIGAASAVKMSTASFYKGQTALLAQALRSAAANGVLEVVLEDLRRNYPELVESAPRILQSIAAKSGRYVAEMREISATQGQAGLTPDLFEALATVYDRLSRTEAAGRPPESVGADVRLEDVLAALVEPYGA
jgi:3-hydroxyisobutyrate dehydrogenase-like beta-hydroxyacid dehydrogenase